MKKRLVSLLLAFSMMLTFMPVGAIQAFAEDSGQVVASGFCGVDSLNDYNDAKWTLTRNSPDENTYTLTISKVSGSGRMDDFADQAGVGVGKAPWLWNQNYAAGITKIQIEDGMVSIGNWAFWSCSNLQEISIPDSVTSIGDHAFWECKKIEKISIPSTVTEIGAYAFGRCTALKDIGNENKLPDRITKIKAGTFCNTALSKITLPAGLSAISEEGATSGIEQGAFEKTALTTIDIPSSVTRIGAYTFKECNKLEAVKFAKDSKLNGIGQEAFEKSALTQIEVPDTVKIMGQGVFSECRSLTKVTLSQNIKAIPDSTFYECSALSDVNLKGAIMRIGKHAFYGVPFDGTYTIPSSVTYIDENGVGSGSLKVFLPKDFKIATTVQNAFYYGIAKIYFPDYKSAWDTARAGSTINGISADGKSIHSAEGSRSHDIPILYLCKVTFKNGDTVLAQSPVTDTYRTEKIGANVVPTVEGLEYWYTDPDDPEGSKVNLAAYEVPDDVTLYAKAKTHVNATISIAGPDNTNVKAGEPSDSFTVTVTENDDTGVKTKFTVSENVKDLQYSEDNGTTWKSMTEDELNKEWGKSDLDGKQFRVVPKNDAEAGNATVTVKLVKDNGAEAKANFNVTKRTHAAVAISDLSGQLVTTKSYEFTVTVTPNDDVGEATLTFDDVAGLTYEGEEVTSAGVKLTDFTEAKTLTFTLTPTEASDSKTLKATLTTAADCTHEGTANYTVRAYKGAEVEINWKDNDTSEVKPGDENGKEFVVKVTPNDDGGKLTIDIAAKDGEKIQYKDSDGEWKDLTDGKFTADLDEIKKSGKDSEEFEFRVIPKDDAEPGEKDLTITVKKDGAAEDDEPVKKTELNYTVAKKDDGGNENPNPNPGGDGGNTGGNGGETPNPNPGGGESGGDNENPKPNPGDNTGDNTDTDETKNWETITVEDGSITKVLDKDGNDITDKVISTKTVDETSKTKLIYKAPAGAKVTVKANDAPENMKFKMWVFSVANMNGDPNNDVYSSEMTFTVPKDGVIVSAMYESADIDDGGYEIIGPIVIGGTIVAGSAALGYQTYSLVTDFLGSLYGLPYFPSNRSALALMLWENAGKPEPESDILYPDVGWEEQDMDLQHAARWAMEHELLPDKNDKDAELAPEEVKFFPNDMITKASVLKAWMKALELKKAN